MSSRGAVLPTLQIDRGSLHFGLRVLRPDRNRLLVAACGQAQIGGKYWTLGDDLKARAFDFVGTWCRQHSAWIHSNCQ